MKLVKKTTELVFKLDRCVAAFNLVQTHEVLNNLVCELVCKTFPLKLLLVCAVAVVLWVNRSPSS